MDFPKLQQGQFAVLKAKTQPAVFLGLGPVLDLDHGRWRVFSNFAAARRYAVAQVAAQPSLECGIYDARTQEIYQVRL